MGRPVYIYMYYCEKPLTVRSSTYLLASGSRPTCEMTLIPAALLLLSAMLRVSFWWVKESVECGRKESFVLNTAWPCRPVPCLMNRWLKSP